MRRCSGAPGGTCADACAPYPSIPGRCPSRTSRLCHSRKACERLGNGCDPCEDGSRKSRLNMDCCGAGRSRVHNCRMGSGPCRWSSARARCGCGCTPAQRRRVPPTCRTRASKSPTKERPLARILCTPIWLRHMRRTRPLRRRGGPPSLPAGLSPPSSPLRLGTKPPRRARESCGFECRSARSPWPAKHGSAASPPSNADPQACGTCECRLHRRGRRGNFRQPR
mmetsp:Transcript_73370/g.203676  ORF Transcript_73370/g.203676 Transcript_73370/m.203676 type:complete len:224 (-) Transcript_73370:649-1320(-)